MSPVQTGSQALSLHTAVGRWAQGWSGCAGACQSGTASTACVVCSSLRQLRQHSGRARVDSARGRDILAFSGRRALHPLRDSWGSTEPKRHQTVSNQSAFLRLQMRPGYPLGTGPRLRLSAPRGTLRNAASLPMSWVIGLVNRRTPTPSDITLPTPPSRLGPQVPTSAGSEQDREMRDRVSATGAWPLVSCDDPIPRHLRPSSPASARLPRLHPLGSARSLCLRWRSASSGPSTPGRRTPRSLPRRGGTQPRNMRMTPGAGGSGGTASQCCCYATPSRRAFPSTRNNAKSHSGLDDKDKLERHVTHRSMCVGRVSRAQTGLYWVAERSVRRLTGVLRPTAESTE